MRPSYRSITVREGVALFLEGLPEPKVQQTVVYLNALRRWVESYTGSSWPAVDWCRFIHLPGTALFRPIGPQDMTAFLQHWRSESPKGRTVCAYNHLIREVGRYFQFEVERGAVYQSPVAHLKPLVYTPNKKPILNGSEIQRLLLAAACDPMDYALVLTSLGLGLRPQEVRLLTEGDLRFDLGLVRLHGKFRDTTQVLSQAVTLTLEEDWLRTPWRLQVLAETPDPRHRPVFVRSEHDPRPLSAEMIRRRLQNIVQRAGIEKHVVPYTLRRTFAVMLYRAGTNPLLLSQLLRHRGVQTLVQYLRNDPGVKDTDSQEILAWIGKVWRPGFAD